MDYRRLHPWDVSPPEAIRIQQELRTQVAARDADRTEFQLIAGMDVSYDKHSPWLFAAIVVLRLPGFQRAETVGVRAEAKFPYVPGLLSFRESPAGLQAWERLRTRPDCLICDGHGYAHPRRFGFACHFGLLVDLPTIGFAKSVLIGSFKAPGSPRGGRSDLEDAGEVIGAALRTREGAEPVFVSVGHRVSLGKAVETILACSSGYRIPEPIRQAHALVNRLRQTGVEPAGAGNLFA
ncbi:MAG TPA: deoxyribonuclease V [Candidatus Methylomirabilis sp.]|nr:deoxyribonuclease V [Candidatus Methylomirabilis sp.]